MIQGYGIQEMNHHGPVISPKVVGGWRRKAIFCLHYPMAYRLTVKPVMGLRGGIS